MSAVLWVRRIRGQMTDNNGIGDRIKMGTLPKWFQQFHFRWFNGKLIQLSRRKMKFLSETCKRGSITVLKLQSLSWKCWRFLGLKIVIGIALRQRRWRSRRQTLFWKLWGVLCFSSTFLVFLVTFLNFRNLNQILRPHVSLSLPLALSHFFSLGVHWGRRETP